MNDCTCKSKDGIVAVIRWHVDDIKCALAKRGLAASDENVSKLLDGTRFVRTLEERSIEEGWDIIDILISFADGDEVLLDCYDKEANYAEEFPSDYERSFSDAIEG